MGASFSILSRKRKSPEESSPPDARDEQAVQLHKKLKLSAKPTTIVDDYQVFLSFRGPDTRFDFTDVLYEHMDRVGIRVFKDDEEIRVGERIDVILKAIENSEICVPILSESFASSVWCLREVEKMVELEKKVIPIFYKVTADDVKLKTKLYKKAMKGHVAKHGKDQVDKWTNALNKIAKIKGMEVSAKTSYTEFYKKFVNDVLRELSPRKRCHTDHLVGMDSRIKSILELLDIGAHDQKYMVIHGMSGIGKTTLAKAVFNKISTVFDNACFLEDIPEYSCRDLQKNLLEGLDPKSIGQSNLSGDITERFYKRKVLMVLDDIEKWEQIEKIAGHSCWFGAGSRIIVTTRNKDVLNRGALAEDEVLSFEMKTLVCEEAKALFCWYAFRKNIPSVGFEALSREIVQAAEGLPLTLKVTGSNLYKKDEKVWMDVISKLKKVPVKEVAKRLRISYDALEDDQKKIFLDISCIVSIAKESTRAVYMWEACELHPHYGLEVLRSMSMIRIDDDSIWMHNQFKYLGKTIVQDESKDPSKRSRLWDHKEAIKVLMSTEGKENVEALVLEDGTGITLLNEYFVNCRELRFLQLAGASITGDFENLLPNLRWLSWKYCPAIFRATNLFMKNLVNLDLSRSFINESWGGWKLIQILKNLKVLDLSSCKRLTRTPEFSENNSLERLVFSDCRKLREIHGSIGKLQRLKYLNLKNCYSLGGLPDEIGCLVNLEVLHASGSWRCSTFKLPNSVGCLKSLSDLSLNQFFISDIPDSIGGLRKLKYLFLGTCAKVLPESLGDLQSLVKLTLINKSECKLPNSLGRLVKLAYMHVEGGTNLDELLQSLENLQELSNLSLTEGTVKKIPAFLGKMKNLVVLHLNGVLEEVPTELFGIPSLRQLRLRSSSFSTLPADISQLKLLEVLELGTNHMLEELPDLPLSLRRLRVSSKSLRRIANLSRLVNLTELKVIAADDYRVTDGGIEKLIKLGSLHLGIETANAILQFDLASLTLLGSLTLDFQQDLDSDAQPLLLPPASSSSPDFDITSQGSRLGLKCPNLSTLKNNTRVVFLNCFIKDGIDILGIQHVNLVSISNCSVEVIELTCQLKNLRDLCIWSCGSLPDLSSLKNKNLEFFSIYDCKEVVEITGLGSFVSLTALTIVGCTSLERLENLSKLENLSSISLYDCPKLRTIEVFEGLLISYLLIQNCGILQISRDELRKRCIKHAYINID